MGYSDGAMRLGPVARKLIDPCAWKDGYPGPPAYVRELDALLHFANQNGYLRGFVPTLEAQDRQRDKSLNELRLAYFFKSLGFDVTEWDPPGASRKKGEFSLAVPGEPPVFVEVKSRGWESELSGLSSKLAWPDYLNSKYVKAPEPLGIGRQYTNASPQTKHIPSSCLHSRTFWS